MSVEIKTLVADLAAYATRFANMNGEPEDGYCRELLRLAETWSKEASAAVNAQALISDLGEFVERFADLNGEPEGGDCRRLLSLARAELANGNGAALRDVVPDRSALPVQALRP